MTVSASQYSLWLEVDGVEERIPLVSYSGTFALNQIPAAVVQLASSRDAVTGLISAATQNFNSLKRARKVSVYFQPTGELTPGTAWPDKVIKIFDGKIAGPGFTTGEGLSLQLHLRHWLADLDYSSALSALHHPQNPASLIAPAVVSPHLTTGVTKLTTGIGDMISATSLAQVAKDVWAASIKEGMCQLAKQKHIRLDGELSPCEVTKLGENTQALAALSRFDGPSETCPREYSPYSFPLALDTDKVSVPQAVVEAVQRAIHDDMAESWAYQTFWGKLVGYFAPALMCQVVPLVEHALFVPMSAGGRNVYCQELLREDITGGRAAFSVPRPLRAVGVYATIGSPTGLMKPGEDNQLGLGGCYFAKDAPDDGVIMAVSSPPWLDRVGLAGHVPGKAAGFDATIGTATTPAAFDSGLEREGVADETKLLDTLTQMASRYAQAVFVTEQLRGREGSVVSRLRFDIAPGSTVRVHPTSLVQTGDKLLELEQPVIGLVTHVAIVLNAETPTAITTFRLSFLRTEEENKSDDTSIDNHPLFKTLFAGAPLVDDLNLPACP